MQQRIQNSKKNYSICLVYFVNEVSISGKTEYNPANSCIASVSIDRWKWERFDRHVCVDEFWFYLQNELNINSFLFHSRPYEKPLLFNMEFALIGKLKSSKQQIESSVRRFGGKVVANIHDKLAAIISNEDEITKMGPKMIMAKTYNIQVVSEDFLTDIETTDPYICIISRSLSDWGGNVSFRSLQ